MSDRRGCNPLALLGARKALGQGPALPQLELSTIHREDRRAVSEAHAAARGAHAALFERDHGVSDAVVGDLGAELVRLVDRIHELGRRLAEGRAFLERNNPDVLARERAEVELKLLGADAATMVALKGQMKTLAERGALADRVQGELSGLQARLSAAGGELEAFRARIDAHLGSEDLLHELRAYQQSAEAALQAFEATRLELGR